MSMPSALKKFTAPFKVKKEWQIGSSKDILVAFHEVWSDTLCMEKKTRCNLHGFSITIFFSPANTFIEDTV